MNLIEPAPSRRYWPAALFFVCYLLAAVLGLKWAVVQGAGSSFWPAAGVGMIGLMVGGLRLWPVILVGRILAGFIIGSQQPLWAELAIATVNVIATAGAVMLFHLRTKLDPRLNTLRDMLRFLGGAGALAVIAATLGTAILWISTGLSAWDASLAWMRWISSNFAGAATVGALLLVWFVAPRAALSTGQKVHLGAVLVATTIGSVLIFLSPADLPLRTWHSFPLLIWAALAFSVRGAAPALVIVASFAVLGSSGGMGPFVDLSSDPLTRMIFVQQFVGITAPTILLLGAISDERQAKQALEDAERALREKADQLAQFNATLEDQVAERTRELVAAEEARRAVDALYKAYFEHTPDPLFVIGVAGEDEFIIEQVNPAHEIGVGFKLEDIRLKSVRDVLPHDTAERVIETYRHVVQTGKTYHYRDVFELSGESQHWETTPVPLRDDSASIVRLIGTSRNITRQVLAEEALRQSQKMEAMGQLTGGVAHDFNNLLTPIIGSLDRLLTKGVGDERDRRLIKGAAQAADRAKTLVQRLLSFARRQPLQAVPVELGKLVDDMGGLIASTTGPQIKLDMDTPASLPAAVADPNQLEMALLNLCVNARDAMPEGGTLRISVSAETLKERNAAGLRPGPYLRLSVADTGAGMDESTLRRAVEPFFSTKGIGQGTGLGLSMVHGLAAQLGGALSLSSQVGLGTKAELWLPQSPVPAQRNAETAARADVPDRSGAMALLVDDEELVRAATAAMLQDLGYAVREASSAEEALKLIDRGLDVQLLVTDHLMPGMPGTELAQRVLRARPGTRVLIISGYAETDGIDPGLPRLSKPFRQTELAGKLRELVKP